MTRSLVVLTVAGSRFGLGHFTRCSALSEALEHHGWQSDFFVDGDADFEFHSVNSEAAVTVTSWLTMPPNHLSQLVRGNNAVLFDSYLTNQRHLDAVPTDIARWVVDENTEPILRRGDALLNTGSFGDEASYRGAPGVLILAGMRYFYMRRPFWDVQPTPLAKSVSQVLFFMGGGTPPPRADKLLSSLLLDERIERIEVLGGELSIRDPSVRYLGPKDANGVKAALRRSDIAVSAAGQMLYELARCGTPTIAVQIADNQARNYEAFRKRGAILGAGSIDVPSVANAVLKAFDRLAGSVEARERMRTAQLEFVDGQGARRAAEALHKHFLKTIIQEDRWK